DGIVPRKIADAAFRPQQCMVDVLVCACRIAAMAALPVERVVLAAGIRRYRAHHEQVFAFVEEYRDAGLLARAYRLADFQREIPAQERFDDVGQGTFEHRLVTMQTLECRVAEYDGPVPSFRARGEQRLRRRLDQLCQEFALQRFHQRLRPLMSRLPPSVPRVEPLNSCCITRSAWVFASSRLASMSSCIPWAPRPAAKFTINDRHA